jgi:peptidoglycan/LPS O-acetylase OafA/YrhL
MNETAKARRLVAVGVVGMLLFSYPLMAVFDGDATVWGVPVLWAYFFVVWAMLIALAAALLERSR